MAEKTHQDDLDWNNLSNPVPLDLIDPEFEPHALPQDLPGSRSEILPRAESEAFAAAHEAAASLPDPAPPSGAPASDEPAVPGAATLQMPARGVPNPTGSGGTTFGAWPQEHAEIQDAFSRMRAKMEAESEAEKKAKLEADQEEASQRERLDQWMANARNRLLKADADLAGPSARIRIRKDHSPSLYRLAEMQKTIWVEGQATHLDSQTSSLRAQDREDKGDRGDQGDQGDQGETAAPRLDPMATISVPAEQFLTLDAPAQPTMREQALARQAAQQAAQVAAVKQAAARPMREAAGPPPVENALSAHVAHAAQAADAAHPAHAAPQPRLPAAGRGETAYAPMTREQALTRKVAQLRKVAEGGDNTLAIGPGESPQERSALHFAIAAVVIAAIVVLGVGLFAATQAGLFDGLENRVPFLRPNASPRLDRPAARSIPAATAPAPSSVAKSPSPDVAPGNQPSAPVRSPALPLEPAPALAAPPRPAARPSGKPIKPASKTAVRPQSAPSAQPARPAAPAADPEDGEIPAYAKPRAKAANLGEIVLRASVQAASNIDKDNLLEMYNRYALGFPGLSGEVRIGLTVDPGGRILEGSVVSSTTGVEAFDQELLRKVLDWRLRAFPESRPKFIVVPFLFPLQGR
jgi:TonB family protein